MTRLKFIAPLAGLLFHSVISAQQVDYVTPEEAVNLLLGEGIVATNISYTGDPIQLGHLSGYGGTVFPVGDGVILSSDPCKAVDLTWDFSEFLTSAVSGEPDLLTIANSVPPLIGQFFSVGSANDVCILEFDFIPTGDSLKFNYTFGSDEYLEWVNSAYNDVFAFFLSGPGITGTFDSPPGFPDGAINIAFVPDSDPLLPITISSVNTSLNSAYYIDNVNNTDISSDGFTVTLTAEAEVQCGATYHIKLAIADGSDTALESIVVLEAGSFSSNAVSIEGGVEDPPVFLPGNTVLEGCVDGFFTLFQPNVNSADTLQLIVSGSAMPGEDYVEFPEQIIIPQGVISVNLPFVPNYDPETEGTETVTVAYFYTNSCGDADTAVATMYIQDYVDMVLSIDEVFICPGDDAMVNGEPENGAPGFSYQWTNSLEEAIGSNQNQTFNPGDEGDYTITVTDFCNQTISTGFHVEEPDPFVVTESIEMCMGATAGNFAEGGAMPYEYQYNDSAFNMSGPEEFTALWEGEYTIGVTDQCDQFEAMDVLVEVCNTVLPNIFTPNGDGDNEMFVIEGIEGFPKSALTIFNRWGNRIFESDNYRNTWSGDDFEDGVYFYIFERSDGKTFEGYVHLKRGKD